MPLNAALCLLVPLGSLLVVSMMFVVQRRRQRRGVLFLVNFLSLFTNQEMREDEVKALEMKRESSVASSERTTGLRTRNA